MAKILVVDDGAENVESLERDLRSLGYQVVSSLDGVQALAMAEAHRPDVILLGLLMSHLDGIEVCRRLKASPALQSIPVILVSALAQEEHVVKGLDAGAVDYVTKPYSGAILAARVRSALRMKEAQDAVLAAPQLRSDFLATTSDELRTPLVSILEFAKSLLEPTRSEEERREAINSIRCSGDHLLQIVDDIRDLSEIQTGGLDVELAECSPTEIVAEVETLMRRHARGMGSELSLEYAGPIPEKIQSDPTRLRQILLNLLSNAVRFNAQGNLRVRVEFLPRGANGSRLQFEVVDGNRDPGDGELVKLFRPYAQIDPSTIRSVCNGGLGLTISNQLTELLGGDMCVACDASTGWGVRIRVPTGALNGVALLDQPRTAPPIRSGEAAFPGGARPLGGCRLLLAEGDPTTRKSISGLLAKAGAEVTIAISGPAAVGLAMAADAAGSPFEVVLMDTHLSALGGDGAIPLLRKRGYARPIIALSTVEMAQREGERGGGGHDDMVVKPIHSSRLIAAIGNQLTGRSAAKNLSVVPEFRGRVRGPI